MDVIGILESNVELISTGVFVILVIAGIDLVVIKTKIKQAKILLTHLDAALEDDTITAEEYNDQIKPAVVALFGTGIFTAIGGWLTKLVRKG